MTLRPRTWVIATLLVLLPLTAAWAQTTGTLRGVVRDPNGAPLPGVVISVTDGAAVNRSVTSNAEGGYIFTAIGAGGYTLTAELEGFQKQAAEVRVNIATVATVNFSMQAEFSEELLVTSETPIVDVKSSSVSSNYTAEFIEDLPTRRNFYDMISLSPGISQTSEGSDRQVAFGSNMQSNAWHVDGLNTSAPETGSSWWSINPDTVEEVQVLGLGVPAEYGNMLGAAFNVVTKSGTNEFKGGVNAYVQDDSWTDANTDADTPGVADVDPNFPEFTRDAYPDITGTLGGPILRDRLWFFGAYETLRDGYTEPGNDPAFTPVSYSDRSDLKLTLRVNNSNIIDAKGHYDDWGFPDAASPYITPDASTGENGRNPAWGITWNSILSGRTSLDVKYAGWWSNDNHFSQTGATATPFVNYDNTPTTYSGSPTYPWYYETWRHQFDVKLSHFTDNFIKGDHDFRFGVQYNKGNAETEIAPGPQGFYIYQYYGYQYLYEHQPYIYGGKQDAISAFVDDTWTLGDRFTLNLGVRYDRHEAWVPDYPEILVGGARSGRTIPGIDPILTWNNLAPRLGFAYSPSAAGKSVIRGSFGIYYDGNVSGNWDFPPPGIQPSRVYAYDPVTQTKGDLINETVFSQVGVDPDLEAPRTYQYSLGWERQFGTYYAIGVQGTIKDTDRLVGWQIGNDGVYEPVQFFDSVTGQTFTLLSEIEPATLRKGNNPGFTAAGQLEDYFQDYRAVLVTFRKRLSNGWSMMASYTNSKSDGLIPRMLVQSQFNPFYGSREGADPNNYINADQLLQGDREHMFRVQGNFEQPLKFLFTTVINFQDGRPHNIQRRTSLGQGLASFIVSPASDDQRLPSQQIVDASIGRRFKLGGDTELKLDLQVLNALNEDANDFFQILRVTPTQGLIPSDWVFPRRLMLRLGVEF